MRGAENLQTDPEEVHGAGQQQAHHAPRHQSVAMRPHVAGTRQDSRILIQQPGPFALTVGQYQVRDESGRIIFSVNKFGVDINRSRPKIENKPHSGDNHHFWFI